jgi:hypothetical protein
MQHYVTLLKDMSEQFLSQFPGLTKDPDSGSERIFSPFSKDPVSKT